MNVTRSLITGARSVLFYHADCGSSQHLPFARVHNLVYTTTCARADLSGEDEAKIEEFVTEFLECMGIPGMAVAAVRGGQVELTTGYGKADTDADTDVTGRTLFNVASTSKAFTAVLLAQLLEEHEEYDWDTPVQSIIGDWFHFSDGYRTNGTTLRDLLSHKMTVPRHDYVWILDKWSSQELLPRIRFFEPTEPYRSAFMYHNLMYTVAGHVAEAMEGGATWEDLTRERIFDPLQMEDSLLIHETDNYEGFATPYTRNGGERVAVPWEMFNGGRCIPGAGSVCSNAQDMAKWLLFLLGHSGSTDPPLDPVVASQTFRNEFATGFPSFTRPTHQETLDLIGLYSRGWFSGHYRGYNVKSHGGDFAGFHSYVSLFPDMDIGIFTSMNFPDFIVERMWVHAFIADVLLGKEPWFDAGYVCSLLPPVGSDGLEPIWDLSPSIFEKSRALENTRDVAKEPLRPLLDYVGDYGNFGYGNVTIFLDETENLQLEYGNNGHYDLIPTEAEHVFETNGNTPVSALVNLYSVVFSGDDVIDTLTIPAFEINDPPVFVRDLLLVEAPPPDIEGCAP